MECNSGNIERLYEMFKKYPIVVTDSRKVVEGSIFFALQGETFDGNRFAARALEQGAVMAVVDDASICTQETNYFYVKDTLAALQQLAAMHRRRLNIPVIGITGTNGKTTTKELVVAVLSKKYRVTATAGNFNNHIGVPLTLLRMSEQTQIGVVEMGASAKGEIDFLCHIAAPSSGIITNIGRAHLEGFGGVEGIKKGKGELYDFLAANGGEAFVRADDRVLCEMADKRSGMKCCKYESSVSDGFRSSLTGDYNRFNIAAAIAIGSRFGVDESLIRQAIEDYVPDNNRSQRVDSGKNLLIVDCYNANPSSMASAIDSFETMHDEKYRRKAMILGDMLELGEWSLEEHERVIESVRRCNCQTVYLVGPNFAKAYKVDESSKYRFMLFANVEELKAEIQQCPLIDNMVLVKGSHGMKLEQIVELL